MNYDAEVGCFVLDGNDPRTLLSHMAFYGLAAIVEAATSPGLRLSWTEGMTPRPQIYGPGLTARCIAGAVRCHASVRARRHAWPAARVNLTGIERGLLSPRLAAIDDWGGFQRRRHGELDRLTNRNLWLDLQLLWSLGEPCYWRFLWGKRLQDDASSRLEMQPRNRGSEIVSQRFTPLADNVSKRTVEEIVTGLQGNVTYDEWGGNQPDSLSGIGFRGPGPVDDAVAWCALWGISQFPLVQSTRQRVVTAGHIGGRDADSFYVPVWVGGWTPSRLRTVLASGQLRAVATAVTARGGSIASAGQSTGWLIARGVRGMIVFPVERSAGASATYRQARQGVVHRLGAAR